MPPARKANLPVAARTLAQVAEAFDHHGVCWSRYQSIAQLVRDDEACSTANPMFNAIEQPGVGSLLAPGLPLDFGGVPRQPAGPAPVLGQHTEEVLAELLGIDAAQYGRLNDKGVVRKNPMNLVL